MAKANRNKDASAQERGAILLEAQVNRLNILLEQIGGVAELVDAYAELGTDAPFVTAINVIKEKAHEAESIINQNFGRLTPDVMRLREENAKRRTEAMARIDAAKRDVSE